MNPASTLDLLSFQFAAALRIPLNLTQAQNQGIYLLLEMRVAKSEKKSFNSS